MKRKLLIVALAIPLLLGGAAVTVASKATAEVDVPLPAIKADTSPAAVARGAVIFHTMCESCHRGADSEHASGTQMKEIPPPLGTFYSANITMHPTAGIGALNDGQIARAIRYGVDHLNHKSMIATFGMGDADVAAVIGFMRSGDPLFTPDPKVMPHSELSFLGKIIFSTSGMSAVPNRPASGIPVPPKTDKVAYGRYLAHEVFDCAGCHTTGFNPDKTQGADVFAGGFEFKDPTGATVFSPNITFHETGLAKYSQQDLARAIRDGLRPDASVVRPPMPRFRGVDDEEVAALYEYLKTVPQKPTKVAAK